jgi:hypothetical protein
VSTNLPIAYAVTDFSLDMVMNYFSGEQGGENEPGIEPGILPMSGTWVFSFKKGF